MTSKEIFSRTELLVGADGMSKLAAARVAVFGVGGVGSWCAEALVRSGIRDLTIVDSDTVSVTNINRQAMALTTTVGRPKVEALRDRLLAINPEAEIKAVRKIYCEETAGEFDFGKYDAVVDCIDSLKDKITLIMRASASPARFYSALGAGLKVDPTKIRVAPFWEVRGCPLGSALRKKMRREGKEPAKPFLCVYDDEVLPNKGEPEDPSGPSGGSTSKAVVNGTLAHITGIFGFTLAGLVISDIL